MDVIYEGRGESTQRLDIPAMLAVATNALRATGRYEGMLALVQAVDTNDGRFAVSIAVATPAGIEYRLPAIAAPEAEIARALQQVAAMAPVEQHDRLATQADSLNPSYNAHFVFAASRAGNRRALAAYGNRLFRTADGDPPCIQTSLDALTLGGAPRIAAEAIVALARAGTLTDASRFRAGGVRALLALGDARLVATMTFLGREVMRLYDPAYRSPPAIQKVADVVSRLVRFGIVRPELESVLKAEWLKTSVAGLFGNSMAKLAQIALYVAGAMAAPEPLPREMFLGGTVAIEMLLGSRASWTVDPKEEVPMRALTTAVFKAPEALDPFLGDEAWTAGCAKFGAGDLPGAINALRIAHRSRPEDGELAHHLALMLGMGGQLQAQRELLEATLGTNEARADRLALLAGSFVDTGDFERGIDLATRALEVDPLSPNGRTFRALAQSKIGRRADAEEDAALARTLHTLDPGVDRFLAKMGL